MRIPDGYFKGVPREQVTNPPEQVDPTSEEGLALEFARRHEDELRYVAGWGRWLRYCGDRWAPDDTLVVFDLVRALCREVSSAANKPKQASTIASAKTVAAVERLARSDRRLAATTDQWDVNPWLLNTPSGVVDLRTGGLREHDPSDYMTKVSGAGPGEGCPTWLRFLDRVTAGDVELQRFIQRMAGYGLTGDTSAHALFFGYGHGANGKSVLTETLAGVLGDYHKTAPIETFTASNSERHPTDLAMLRGARLVTAVETEQGRAWAESRIKSLTGGDMISARFMRQDFFEYRPQFKLLISGNHKPGLRSVDEAIRRRFHLIPFAVTIPSEERDPHLAEKLRAEWPGILAWAVEGCLSWQAEGLAAPKAVLDATDAYLDGEDALTAWIDECCIRDPGGWELSQALFTSWRAWADRAGEKPGHRNGLAERLEKKGFLAKRTRAARGIEGLRLKPTDMGNDDWNER
jgi:putative DNA primase/helicase